MTDAALAKQRRAGAIEPDRRRDGQHRDEQQGQRYQRQHKIHPSLDVQPPTHRPRRHIEPGDIGNRMKAGRTLGQQHPVDEFAVKIQHAPTADIDCDDDSVARERLAKR